MDKNITSNFMTVSATTKMSQPTNMTIKLTDIDRDLTNGDMVIPNFQRDFVWRLDQSAKLLDSWIKGFPLGAFILWTSKEKLQIIKEVGSIELVKQKNEDNPLTYVLDGQQRITSIFASIKGVKVENKDFSRIVINLDAKEDEDIVTVLNQNEDNFTYIRFKDLYDFDLQMIFENFSKSKDYIAKISEYHNKLISFDFPVIKISGQDLVTATEIFTRLNTGGKTLSDFEIMVAKTYANGKFNLKDQVQDAIAEFGSYLDFESYKSILMNAVPVCLKGDCKKKTLFSISRDDFLKTFNPVKTAFSKAVNFFKNDLCIPHGGFIPYNVMLLPFVFFFYKLGEGPMKKPDAQQTKNLKNYFWRSVINERYQSSTDSRVSEDIKKVITKILDHKDVTDFSPVTLNVPQFIENGDFSMGRAYIKGMVDLLISMKPVSLSDNSEIKFDENWPIKINSNNYHHFFPKKMKGLEKSQQEINNIANILLSDAYTNQVIIKNRAPSEYMAEFSKTNPTLKQTLEKHLVGDLTEFGVWDDDFDEFVKHRAAWFIKELQSRLIKNPKDDITY